MEILVGTQDGCLMHSTMNVNSQRESKIEALEGFNFATVLEIGDHDPILDLKIARIKGNIVVLAVTATKLNQFAGKDLRTLFD